MVHSTNKHTTVHNSALRCITCSTDTERRAQNGVTRRLRRVRRQLEQSIGRCEQCLLLNDWPATVGLSVTRKALVLQLYGFVCCCFGIYLSHGSRSIATVTKLINELVTSVPLPSAIRLN